MLELLKELTTLIIVIPLLGIGGLLLSVQLRWPQIFRLRESWQILMSLTQHSESATTRSAVAAALGGNLGTGNIAGMAVALTMGGPGALFWMWVMAFIAAIFKFCECYLSVDTRQVSDDQKLHGGPMYYIGRVIDSRLLAAGYSIALILAACTVGNLVQVHSLTLPLNDAGISPFLPSILVAVLLAGVLLGGFKRFKSVVGTVVPLMAMLYIAICLIILFLKRSALPCAIITIFSSAMTFESAGSGLMGMGALKAIQVGFDRGLFATDAGSGLAGILHAPVSQRYKSRSQALSQAIASLISPLIVMVICMLTGLVLLVSGIDISAHESTSMCVAAFEASLLWKGSGQIVTVTLFFFAFTTILTWEFCGARAIHYLLGARYVPAWRVLFVALIPFGAFAHAATLWELADLSINVMLIVNAISILKLRRYVRSGAEELKQPA